MKPGHGALGRDYMMGPSTVLLRDPCPFGLPVVSTVVYLASGVEPAED